MRRASPPTPPPSLLSANRRRECCAARRMSGCALPALHVSGKSARCRSGTVGAPIMSSVSAIDPTTSAASTVMSTSRRRELASVHRASSSSSSFSSTCAPPGRSHASSATISSSARIVTDATSGAPGEGVSAPSPPPLHVLSAAPTSTSRMRTIASAALRRRLR